MSESLEWKVEELERVRMAESAISEASIVYIARALALLVLKRVLEYRR